MVTAVLHDDNIEAILSWLPVKSLIRFKCVGKSWCAMIGKPYFKEQHRTRSALRPDATHLLLTTYKQAILTASHDGGATSDHTLPNILEHGPYLSSCCHGLISMHPSDKAKGNTFVYNPNTRETLSIPFNANAFRDCNSVRSFIGFEPVSNQYKLMIFSVQCKLMTPPGSWHKEYAYISKHCEIITLGTKDWRQVVTNDTCPVPLIYGLSTCLNGALHWLAFDRQRIAVFDLKSHKFGTIPGPERKQEVQRLKFKLCQVRGRLTLVECGTYRVEASFELWTLKDCCNGVWVKESFNFSVPEDLSALGDRYLRVVGGMNDDEILINLGTDQMFIYNMKTKMGRKITVGGEHDGTIFMEYTMLYTECMRCY